MRIPENELLELERDGTYDLETRLLDELIRGYRLALRLADYRGADGIPPLLSLADEARRTLAK